MRLLLIAIFVLLTGCTEGQPDGTRIVSRKPLAMGVTCFRDGENTCYVYGNYGISCVHAMTENCR